MQVARLEAFAIFAAKYYAGTSRNSRELAAMEAGQKNSRRAIAAAGRRLDLQFLEPIAKGG
jgi:hypothetical protein